MSRHPLYSWSAKEKVLYLVGQLPHDGTKIVTITDTGHNRSAAQNRLSWMWYGEIARQLEGMSDHDIQQEAKLDVGVPILYDNNEEFANDWNTWDFDRPTALAAMKWLPVTRIFTVKQMTQYLRDMEHRYINLGFFLTHPEDLYTLALEGKQ